MRSEGFHSPQQQIGRHGVQAGSGNFAEVINAVDQFAIAADSSAERVRMSAEKLGRAVNHKVGAKFQWLLIDRRGKGVIDNYEGTPPVRGHRQPVKVNDFVGRISRTFQIKDLASLCDGGLNRRD